MRLPRNISGHELVSAVEKVYGYRTVHQEGSHIILQTESPQHHRIAIPAHKSLRLGTLNSILRAIAIAQHVSKEDVIRRLFG